MSNLPAEAQIVPAKRAVAITASATAFDETRGVFIETSGAFTLTFAEGSTPIAMTLTAGSVYPFAIVKCTTGTGLVALY
jgi:hypothetical protein